MDVFDWVMAFEKATVGCGKSFVRKQIYLGHVYMQITPKNLIYTLILCRVTF
jgi:hypothetical protein